MEEEVKEGHLEDEREMFDLTMGLGDDDDVYAAEEENILEM